MSSSYRADLGLIVSAVRFLSADDFELAGQAALPNRPPAPPAGVPPAVLVRLQNHLYLHCFTQRFPRVFGLEDSPKTASTFASGLSAANAGTERWDRGWQIDQLLSSGALVVQRLGEYRMVWPGEFVYQDMFGRAPQPGALVSLFLPRESLAVQPGYYFACGSSLADPLDEKYLFRLYWNVPASSATRLLHEVTSRFGRYGVPFRFKLPVDPVGYARVDTAVAYIPRRYFSLSMDLALQISAAMNGGLREEVPLFARRLAPGLAFAEDPGTAESFGTARCRTLALGLWKAYTTQASGLDASLTCVEAAFRSEGISLDHPYLNPGSPGYEFPES